MKIVIVLICCLAAFFAWRWYAADAVPAEQEETQEILDNGTAANDAPSTLGAAIDQAEGRSRNNDSRTQGSGNSNPPQQLSGELMRLMEESDRLWKEIESAGRNPLTDDMAPTLARNYSRVLRATYGRPQLSGLAQKLIEQRLTPLADAIFFSPAPYREDPSGFVINYIVQSGDILDRVGREHGMSYQFINMLRNQPVESANIRPGDRLKLFDLKERGYDMHISISDFRMDLFIGGIFARRYDIGVGEDSTPTPTGSTHINAREKHPQWTDPRTNRVYNYGDPGHIIGPVWLAFDPVIGSSGLGIHGYTGDGEAVQVRASNGCIRMRNEEAVELYNILVPCAQLPSGFVSRAPMRVTITE